MPCGLLPLVASLADVVVLAGRGGGAAGQMSLKAQVAACAGCCHGSSRGLRFQHEVVPGLEAGAVLPRDLFQRDDQVWFDGVAGV